MNRKQVLKNMKKNKKDNKVVEDESVVSRFIFTVGSFLILLIIGYLIIGIFVTKTITFGHEEEEKEEVTIDNNTILAGEIFEQKDEEYYVLVYDVSDTKGILGNWKSLYSGKEDSTKVYVVDSSKKLNAKG